MLLLVGLGNPGEKYAGNRHNIGFMALDAIQRHHRGTPWRGRFHGEASEISLSGTKALLLKPQTYMNDSGRSVRAAVDFYKTPLSDLLVFHDELDLPPGKLRVKRGGGNAGHNGLRSISQHCGNDYGRIRMGIGHPGDKALVHAYVLNDFAKAEQPWVDDLCAATAEHAAMLVEPEETLFPTKVHLFMDARGHGAVKPAAEAGRAAQAAKKAGLDG